MPLKAQPIEKRGEAAETSIHPNNRGTNSAGALRRIVVAHPEKCTGCRMCEIACSLTRKNAVNPKKSAIRVSRNGLQGSRPIVCMQCTEPACVAVCQYEAITMDPVSGAWVVDVNKCQGCGSCVDACPIGAIYLDLEDCVAIKCDLCGGDPHCTKYCFEGVLEVAHSRR
jgi:Fe-S-cluster-containing hydrogenase component 2